jgi:hypothetical protein
VVELRGQRCGKQAIPDLGYQVVLFGRGEQLHWRYLELSSFLHGILIRIVEKINEMEKKFRKTRKILGQIIVSSIFCIIYSFFFLFFKIISASVVNG